jgi:hypothetical protein
MCRQVDNIKMDFRIRMGWYGLEWWLRMRTSEHCNKPTGSINVGNIVE